MATYTPVSKVIAVTGATGVNGFTGAIAALNTAVASAVTTAQAVTGVSPNSISISPAAGGEAGTSAILELWQTITYTVIS